MSRKRAIPLSRFRGAQKVVTIGSGAHIVSPQKRPPKWKTAKKGAVAFVDLEARKRRVRKELEELLALEPDEPPSPSPISPTPDVGKPTSSMPDLNGAPPASSMDVEPDDQWIDEGAFQDHATPTELPNDPGPVSVINKKKRVAPDQAAIDLYAKWQALLPLLVEPLLSFTSDSIGKPVQAVVGDLRGSCKSFAPCEGKETMVLCFYFDHFITVNVKHCPCQALTHTLVRHGLFPTAPDQIRMAVSIDFLDFYSALFERSCDAVNAMAAALNSFYIHRGFVLLNGKGERFREPFRRGLGYAAQWLDGLRALVEKNTQSLLEQANAYLQMQIPTTTTGPTPSLSAYIGKLASTQPAPYEPVGSHPYLPGHPSSPSNSPAEFHDRPQSPPSLANEESLHQAKEASTQSECARRLRQLCPACFGGGKHGRSLDEGGDFQIATDGNFHHRHLVSGGQGVPFHEPKHVIPKSFVDGVGEAIAQARKSTPKNRNPKVPDSAVDECEKSHDAADGDKKKSVSKEGRYDDMGWMSLVCRHDIPLFFANVDTPGEQQKYSIALIIWFFGLIPSHANATVLYDIGCVLDRSTQMYDILPSHIRARVQFVTTAMHAYGHQWSCQLLYNPRLCQGLGLTNGEGVERTWSRLRKLIPLVRTSARARRIWLTDRQLSAIAVDLRDDLGDWIKRRQRLGIEGHRAKAKAALDKCWMQVSELRAQWDLQKAAQLSIRAHAPSRLKKELDTILSLQGELESVDKAINITQAALATTTTPEESNKILQKLLEMHVAFAQRVEALYVSLNLHDSYPDLKGASLDFVRTILMARDLKMNIRKRVIGSFFEWDRLDQAIGGQHQALGTKLHQQTRKAISKRAPALITAIKKFNTYCASLEEMYDPSCNIPLPLPLPTKLADLRDDSNLMEDVWITPSEVKPQPWLDDSEVRSGIRAMIKLDRCVEEQRRLGQESDNLCSWFRRELGAVELAIRMPNCSAYGVQLKQYRDQLLHLKTRWSSQLASAIRFDSHAAEASLIASQITGCLEPPPHKWIYMNTLDDGEDVAPQDGRVQNGGGAEALSLDSPPAQEEEDDDDNEDVVIVSEILQVERDEVEDTSGIAYPEDAMNLQWALPSLQKDDDLLQFILRCQTLGGQHCQDGSQSYAFDIGGDELQILGAKNSLLNDGCMNGLPALLQELFTAAPQFQASASRCAIFSTYDLHRIRYKAPDAELWRNTYRREFWTKDTWIIPIHRRSECHWVLAVLYFQRREVHIFDSLAGKAAWRRDIQSIYILVARLVELANRFGHPMPKVTGGWVAKPGIVKPVQSNGYDCGLWVLAWIAAILRGYGTVGDAIGEHVMPIWRAVLCNLVYKVSST